MCAYCNKCVDCSHNSRMENNFLIRTENNLGAKRGKKHYAEKSTIYVYGTYMYRSFNCSQTAKSVKAAITKSNSALIFYNENIRDAVFSL